MTTVESRTLDANEAVASVAFRSNEVIAIYPITPASPMGEHADEWAVRGMKNIWGTVPNIAEMQSEGGAAGAVHGALQTGALTTTFTASQGLLLMVPTLFKLAGELSACCIHVAARSVATHALSIFGDHSDVMACRTTGVGLLCSSSVQEAHDFACIAQAATLRSRIPFLHFFDGFRTSHEINTIDMISDEQLLNMYSEEMLAQHRDRALSPERPVIRGTAQNPDVFFQSREACNSYYDACPGIVEEEMKRFSELTGRSYGLVEYVGHPQAERVIVVMGSGAETAATVAEQLRTSGEKVGVINLRLYRPFPLDHFFRALPKTVRSIAVLDRTKEPGALGEPLYLDVVSAFSELKNGGQINADQVPFISGGRFGLSSKEFTPAMVKGVFDDLLSETPRQHFTVGIVDDVTHLSLSYDKDYSLEMPGCESAVIFGLGSDGTVGANKNSIKIIGDQTDLQSQAYFEYDSKKSGAVTISHLRFDSAKIRAPYKIEEADFVGCHLFGLLSQYDVVARAKAGATMLLNSPYSPEEVWDELPREVQDGIIEKNIKLYTIDAQKIATEEGLGKRINTIMQVCFFELTHFMDTEPAITAIKEAIEKSYGKKGPEIVRRNVRAVDDSLANLKAVSIPQEATALKRRWSGFSKEAPEFLQRVTATIIAGEGDSLPVSAFPVDGTWPVGSSRWEKRNLAHEIPVWDTNVCIQCNKCAAMCPHAAIRPAYFSAGVLKDAPPTFKSTAFRGAEEGMAYSLQVAPEDCTGCALCVAVCPAKDRTNPRMKAINMAPQAPLRAAEVDNYQFFLDLPRPDRSEVKFDLKGSQFLEPLFECSGACAGCGETPYIKLLTQLFGDRTMIANATGCSSIYGGNLPTTPYSANADGRGPAWSNSLFENNAEFGYGMRLAADTRRKQAEELLHRMSSDIDASLSEELLTGDQSDEAGIALQRKRVESLRAQIEGIDSSDARRLNALADDFVNRSVWIVGGDGWAYDIGYGGLDHVIASDLDVNILVLDTEVYSNTGGQQSKATPIGAAAKYASAGRALQKKDLGMIAMTYGNVYVAQVAMGAKDAQCVRAFREAEAHKGPSLIIAYSHCIAHGYDMVNGAEQQKLATKSGQWLLYRYDPSRVAAGEPPLKMDVGAPTATIRQYMEGEARFRITEKLDPERFQMLMNSATAAAAQRAEIYRQLAEVRMPKAKTAPVGENK
ncbi:MAG: pyruvate-ferredoxin/flavodoxin oxidoreductase [Planctomycetota bacterium]|jgi:pyruvate-ferredoxin/flavodoxin oxidoreductase